MVVVADGHYYADPSGAVYVESVFGYEFYNRYLEVFDHVYAIARITKLDKAPDGKKRADGSGVSFLPLAPGHGLLGYAKTILKNRVAVRRYLEQYGDCVIIRVPGVVSNEAANAMRNIAKPYAVEVVVDPWEYFAPGANGGIARPFVRKAWTADLKDVCKRAQGVAYVTREYLQERYPCREMNGDSKAFSSYYSSVEIPDDSICCAQKSFDHHGMTIAHAANNFSGDSKGHITLLRAISILHRDGLDVSAVFVGDGPSMGEYKALAENLGIADKVLFTGRLADGNEVRRTISHCDLFVFPTMAEGLPRVLLEAMAEGLPCVSSPVCGIPEILQGDNLVAHGDVEGYASRIRALYNDREQLAEMSTQNIETAKEYTRSKLQVRRVAFYEALKRASMDKRLDRNE